MKNNCLTDAYDRLHRKIFVTVARSTGHSRPAARRAWAQLVKGRTYHPLRREYDLVSRAIAAKEEEGKA